MLAAQEPVAAQPFQNDVEHRLIQPGWCEAASNRDSATESQKIIEDLLALIDSHLDIGQDGEVEITESQYHWIGDCPMVLNSIGAAEWRR